MILFYVGSLMLINTEYDEVLYSGKHWQEKTLTNVLQMKYGYFGD